MITYFNTSMPPLGKKVRCTRCKKMTANVVVRKCDRCLYELGQRKLFDEKGDQDAERN
jgi:hypothetical protein